MSLPASAPDTQEKQPSSQGWFWGRYAPLGAAVALATLVLDQANKLWMLLVYGIEGRGRVEVTPFLDFVYVLNTGVSYSMFDSSSYSWQLGLAAFAFAASLGMWIWLCKAGESRLMAWGLSLIIGGALGNAIDRLWLGGVADFLLPACLRVLLVRLQHRGRGHCCRGSGPAVQLLHRESQRRRKDLVTPSNPGASQESGPSGDHR